jgi:transposase
VDHHTEVFVGIDVAKARNAIAVADGERGGEVRFVTRRPRACVA